MLIAAPYPGTPHQQRVLRAIAEQYASDPRVLALLVFGSLGRGDCDAYSDLDLDVVLEDGVTVDAAAELQQLCAALAPLGERAAVIVPKRTEEGDVVLESLLQMSVRYHPLATTSPNIVESMRLLCGRIGPDEIAAAGRANAVPAAEQATVLVGRCVRACLEADVALQRRRFWFIEQALQDVRDHLIELYAATRGEARPLHAFQTHAPPVLHSALAATLPSGDLASAHAALLACLDLLERDLAHISNGAAALTDEQRAVLRLVRERQTQLQLAQLMA